MRDRFSTRLIFILGMLLAPAVVAAAPQEPPVPTPSTLNGRTVAGRVLGETPLQNAEIVAVMLLPGWSETLSDDIAAGAAPTVRVESGRMERVVATKADADEDRRRTGVFLFLGIPPGEYQPVAIRIKEGADAGTAIAEGNRVVVGNDDISSIELELLPLPLDQSGRRHGGAAEREAALIESIGRIPIDSVPVPRNPPVFNPPNRRNPFPTPASSGKKDILAHIVIGLGIALTVFTFTKW